MIVAQFGIKRRWKFTRPMNSLNWRWVEEIPGSHVLFLQRLYASRVNMIGDYNKNVIDDNYNYFHFW